MPILKIQRYILALIEIFSNELYTFWFGGDFILQIVQ
jgi:hypothetical protein